jgi:glycogen debranching enzyme
VPKRRSAVSEQNSVREDMPAVHGSRPPSDKAGLVEDARRPTPLDPYPQAHPEEEAGDEKAYPPELGTDAIAILEGRTFMYSNARGDVPAGSIGGLLHDDTRFLSRWELTIDGEPLSVLQSQVVDYYSAAFFLTNPDLRDVRANTLSVRRLRFVGNGLFEQIAVVNAGTVTVRFELRLAAAADYADLFEVKSRVRDRSANTQTAHNPDAGLLHFTYRVPGFEAETNLTILRDGTLAPEAVEEAIHGESGPEAIRRMELSPTPPAVEGNDLVWRLELGPREFWGAELAISMRVNDRLLEPRRASFGEEQERMEGSLSSWLEQTPHFESDSALLKSVFDKSIVDLAALRIAGELEGEEFVLPAAGLPWFMTLFGRDTLITSLQSVWVGPELTRGALHLLAALQGQKEDDFRDEEPGKILHEVRQGELTILGEKPHSPYYGTADATPLFLTLMSESRRVSSDDDFLRSRWQNVLAALEWIDQYGDRDGDGYVEYQTRSDQGLGNQCWKDSWDGLQFSDGRIPYLPIATAEIQGYVYDAKLRVADLAEHVVGDEALAQRLRSEAAGLNDRFNRDFWSDERGGYYVVGLDGDKRPIDSMTSNMGHLLWSGIVPEERATIVRDQLMSDDMFSGWGVRTMSRSDRGYNPIGYHVGTIWPHDNSIVALGLARYGFRDAANRIALAQLEAASFSDYRLPEAFAGLDRSLARFPVPYPTACSPQAWATGAPFAFVKVMLGLEHEDGEVTLDPQVPEEVGRIAVRGLSAFGSTWDLEAVGTKGHVRLAA